MKRNIFVSVVLVITIIVLSSLSVFAEEDKTITIWSMSRGADIDFNAEFLERYNQTNEDGVTLKVETYTDNFFQVVDIAAATGGPDIIDFPNTISVFTKYVGNGYYVPIDKYMSDEDKALWNDYAIEGVTAYNGEYYMYPIFATTGRLVYNQDIFDRVGITSPPTTLSEMVADARLITETLSGEGIFGFAGNFKSPTGALQRSMDFLIERSGGPAQGFDFKQGRYDFTKFYPEFVKAYREMFADGIMFPGCESLDIDPLRTQFAEGKIGMYISWAHAEPNVYSSQFKTDINWNGAPLPVVDGYEPATQTVTFRGSYLITKDAKYPDLAWKALNATFLSPEYIRAYQEAGYGSCLNQKVVEGVKTADMLVGRENFLIGPSDALWPATPMELNSQAVLVEGEDMYATIFSLILGDEDIDKALTNLTARYNNAYEKGIEQGIGREISMPDFNPAKP